MSLIASRKSPFRKTKESPPDGETRQRADGQPIKKTAQNPRIHGKIFFVGFQRHSREVDIRMG